ncbi:MAG: multidrug transporter [Candidatus Hydrothermarchaeales archaeon]
MWLEGLVFGSTAFLLTLILTPKLAKTLGDKEIIGVDLHKDDRPEIPEMVGVSILAGFLVSSLSAFLFYKDLRILIGVFVVLVTAILGVIDRFKTLTPFQKILSLLLVGIMLVPFSIPPFYGYFGIFYLIFIPSLFMCASNFTNMLAGFNGLEIGTGAIASLGVAVLSVLNQSLAGFILSSSISGALLAFLYYNRYPAKVFPGDVGTLIIGAALFSSIVFGKFYITGAIVFIPYALDATLKYLSAGIMTRQSQTPTILKDGKLFIPEGSNMSLARLFLKRKALTENEVVKKVWLVEAGFCLIAILLELII